MGVILRMAESLLLLFLGGYMFLLSLSPDYSLFLNPKFRPLTGGTGLLLALCAVFCVLKRKDQGRPVRFSMYVLLSGLIVAYGGDPLAAFGPAEEQQKHLAAEPQTTELVVDGSSYLKMNPAELFLLLRNKNESYTGRPLAIRGEVRRSPDLDALGAFTLLRVNVVCCMADAMAMGVVVSLPQGSDQPADGSWFVAHGFVNALPHGAELPKPPRLEEVYHTMINPGVIFRAKGGKVVPKPDYPYVFVVEPAEPFNF